MHTKTTRASKYIFLFRANDNVCQILNILDFKISEYSINCGCATKMSITEHTTNTV